MLQHEETFKQQVYELHRLYQIQRMMMKNMQRSMHNQETWSLKKGTIYKPQKQDLVDEHGSPEIIDESEIELTLGPTSYDRRKNKPTLITTDLNSDSMASFSSSSTDSSHKSRVTFENSRVLRVEEQTRQADRSVNEPPWLRQVLT
ncbi:hypothetical protein L1987_34272 [Smallanthus sonchifolius]|uniref:Uncharacterized protein n=1 Tax=Smallanthus sonchifolius TaxID=185202 RepID=A0ACB9HSU4_9ASTR|nr:hypothetical protein L1987_34272 [Smallanthus sonchifolius]